MRRQLRKNLLSSSSHRPGQTKAATAPEKHRLRDLILVIASLLSLLATFLSLVGYGVTLSILQFNVPHEILFSSTFDLLDLSWWLVFYVFDDILRMSVLIDILGTLINFFWATPLYFVVFLGCAIYFKHQSKASVFVGPSSKLANWFKFGRDTSVLTLAFKTGALSIVLPAIVVLVSAVAATGIVLGAVLLLNAPVIGMNAGERYIREYVVEPEQCTPPRPRLERLEAKTKTNGSARLANCVRVRNERGLCEQGRVVFATTSAILLFEPETGHVFRVPTKDAVIDTLATLDDPATCPAPARGSAATATPAAPVPARAPGTRG